MIARMVLPLAGGSPMVWSTCMVFFQAMLLAGYAYAHASTSWLGVARQAALHALLVLLPALRFRSPFPPMPRGRCLRRPIPHGGFWGSCSASRACRSSWSLPPRRCFSAGSARRVIRRRTTRTFSMAPATWAACSPFWLIRLSSSRVWGWQASRGSGRPATLCWPRLLWVVRWSSGQRRGHATQEMRASPPSEGTDRLGLGQVLRWIVLALVPSSLMLGVTTYMTTDIASIPLLWVIPLALYLLTFILTFARRPPLPHRWVVLAFPVGASLLAFFMSLYSQTQARIVTIPIHLACFFLTAMFCHGELVSRRPQSRHLTAFYLAMSFGGVLGGVFNALVAPIVFDRVLEYPLALLLACLLLPVKPSPSGRARARILDWALPAALGLVAWGAITLLARRGYAQEICWSSS